MSAYRRYKTVVMSDIESDPLTDLLNLREGSLIEHIEKHGDGWLVIYSYADWTEDGLPVLSFKDEVLADNPSILKAFEGYDDFEGGVL